jgi:hypothetical protein
MPDPELKFDKEEMTITLEGLTGGWSLGQLGQLKLMDSAQLQLPAWPEYKKQVALRIIESQWNLSSRLVLEQTLEAGIDFTGKDGVGQSISVDTELKAHLMDRPTIRLDATFKFSLEGKYQGGAYEGSSNVGVGLKLHF